MDETSLPARECLQRVHELSHSGHVDQSYGLLCSAARRFPDDPHIVLTFCYRVSERGTPEDALQHWTEARLRFPDLAEPVIHNAGALMNLGRLLEAETLLSQATERFPDSVPVRIQWSYAAARRQDWEAAAARWRSVLEVEPSNQEALNGLGTAEQHRNLARMDAGILDNLADMEAGGGEASLLLRFESLGDNCEFGFVQRRYRAEPLGLLRWSSIRYPDIIGALDTGFADFDSDNAAHLSDDPGEQMLLIDKLGFRTHCGVIKGDVARKDLLRHEMRRLRFLRDKLLSDLSLGEKTFVFKSGNGQLTDAMIERVLTSVRRHGNGPLLCVRVTDDPGKVGQAEPRPDRLIMGYIDRISKGLPRKEVG